VKDRETKEPLAPLPGLPTSPDAPNVAPRLAKAIRDRGLFCFVKWNHIFPVPPLCLNESQLHDGLRILDEALVVADEMVSGH
jgi:taurine---2-oxoglutarate transaminase